MSKKKKREKYQADASDFLHSRKMNMTLSVQEQWLNEIQFGNVGAALFIITYIGFYGLGIILFFGHHLKATDRQRSDLPAYFLKTLWDVPSKNKLYEELADVERLKRIFRGYFADHELHMTTRKDELQAIVEERAYACALKYREKLRRLHLSHADYYLDTIPRLSYVGNDDNQTSVLTLTHTTIVCENQDDDDNDNHILSVSVV